MRYALVACTVICPPNNAIQLSRHLKQALRLGSSLRLGDRKRYAQPSKLRETISDGHPYSA
jgi:hypothetical protein